jgi:hypothetical protein
MNGPQNYREADLILDGDRCSYGCPHTGCEHEMATLLAALVHSVQALTVATLVRSGLTPADRLEWLKAIDPDYAAEQDAEVTRLCGPT